MGKFLVFVWYYVCIAFMELKRQLWPDYYIVEGWSKANDLPLYVTLNNGTQLTYVRSHALRHIRRSHAVYTQRNFADVHNSKKWKITKCVDMGHIGGCDEHQTKG
ncbi:hypothetical protein MYOV003v1_p0034 [Vibrio phage 207E48.1]|nr:hypothetical protein MYOV003v1_p0034 [Vibrio phage 207E48.1]